MERVQKTLENVTDGINFSKDPANDSLAGMMMKIHEDKKFREVCSGEVFSLIRESRIEKSVAVEELAVFNHIRLHTRQLLDAVKRDLKELDDATLFDEEKVVVSREVMELEELLRRNRLAVSN